MAEARRVAVVTGSASGIGLEISRHLAQQGMSVVAADRDEEACARAERIFDAFGDRVRIVAADIGTWEGAQTAIGAAIKHFGRLDVLCNNAGVHPIASVEELDLDTWRETFRVNVDGALLCSKLALPHMKSQGSGSIVNIGSISGLVPYVGGAAYAASKAALAMLTRVLALEAGPYGVRVNCICPGAIRHSVDPGEEVPAVPGHIPIGRFGKPQDVAHLVYYLTSEEAGYLTGAVLVLDGGATAGRPRRQ